MSQEKIKVLEMLEKGVISTEDALKLLGELEKKESGQYDRRNFRPERPERPEREPRMDNPFEDRPNHEHIHIGNGPDNRGRHDRSRGNSNMDFGWVDELKDGIMESVQNITESIEPIIQDGGSIFYSTGSEPLAQYDYQSNPVGDKIKSINVKGKNSKIEIVPTDDDFITMNITFKSRRNADPHVRVEEYNGEYNLTFDYNVVHSLCVFLRVPKVEIDSLFAETSNSSINATDLLVNRAEFYTKNSRIKLRNLKGVFLHAETRNASVSTEDLDFKDMVIYSSNGEIDINHVNSDEARIRTSNSSINLSDFDIRSINAKTTNGRISMRRFGNMLNAQYPLYSIEAQTSNGGIYLALDENINIPMKVKASTSTSKINCDAKNLSYRANEKNYIEAISEDYEEASRKLDLSLQTSNGRIEIV